MQENEKTCPDCQCQLTRVMLIDQRYMGYSELQYVKINQKHALVPAPDGTVTGWQCPECNRILLYAEPKIRT